jgi:hypothetical protein
MVLRFTPNRRSGVLALITPASELAASASATAAAASAAAASASAAAAAASAALAREVLSAARTYYVRADGSDSNTGLVDSAGGAFLTIQKAVDTIHHGVDLAGFDITIQVGAGTYTGTTIIDGPWVGEGTVSLIGDTTTPSNVHINTASYGLYVHNGARLQLGGFKMSSSAAAAIATIRSGNIMITGKMEYGACLWAAQLAMPKSHIENNLADWTVSGGGLFHLWCSGGDIETNGRTVTITGTPNFSLGFGAGQALGGLTCAATTFNGSATGPRYYTAENGFIETGTQGSPTYFPGDEEGTRRTGGTYDTLGSQPTLLAYGTVSNAATLDFALTLYTQFRALRFVLTSVIPQTDNTGFRVRTSTDGGSTYDAGASNYETQGHYTVVGTPGADSVTDTYGSVFPSAGNSAGESFNAVVTLFDQANTSTQTIMHYDAVGMQEAGIADIRNGVIRRISAADVDGVRFLFSSGNISSAKYALYGIP